MSNLAFDTHRFIKNLTGTGMKAKQAEVLADTYADLLTDRLATKDDIALLKKDIAGVQKDIDGVRSELKKDIDGVRNELKKDIATVQTGLQKDIVASEERLVSRIEKSQLRMAFMVTSLLGFLILIMRFYGGGL